MDSSHQKLVKTTCPIRQLGDGEYNHFFGYYNKSPWSQDGRYVLADRVPMMDADLRPDLSAEVGYFDTRNDDEFHVIGETTTWNWQMGCQLQWLAGKPGRQAIYNVRNDKPNGRYPSFGAVIHNVDSGENRFLPDPIYSVAPNSDYAITVDFSRLFITHETIGYCEPNDKTGQVPLCPSDDGLCRVNLDSGETSVLVSYQDLSQFYHRDSMNDAIHWISHIEINPASTRILFLHRWTRRVEDETCFLHRLMTINPDGSDMRLLEDSDHPLPQLEDNFDPNAVGTYDYEKSEYQISHPMWRDNKHIVVWGPHNNAIHYQLYHDAPDGEVNVISGDLLTENGHMSYSPVNTRWLLTDTYPDSETNIRKLLIYDAQKKLAHEIGEFYTSDLKKVSRCDLHPRWSHDGKQVCIDSVHEGVRQMYILDVRSVVES
ncbi:hypothetical protein LCGC14_0523550 [marine sediment metagenome]|nr:hypothetical protein [Marinobacter antarcticus]